MRLGKFGWAWLLAAVLGLFATPALAQCYYNGVQVPEGTRIGGLVCQYGQWVPG